MANRKRNIQLKIWVSEERKLIEQKMAQLPTKQIGAYLRKMAIDGYVMHTDTTDIKNVYGRSADSRKEYQSDCKARQFHKHSLSGRDIAEFKTRLRMKYGSYKDASYQFYIKPCPWIYPKPSKDGRKVACFLSTAVRRKQRILSLAGRGRKRRISEETI